MSRQPHIESKEKDSVIVPVSVSVALAAGVSAAINAAYLAKVRFNEYFDHGYEQGYSDATGSGVYNNPEKEQNLLLVQSLGAMLQFLGAAAGAAAAGVSAYKAIVTDSKCKKVYYLGVCAGAILVCGASFSGSIAAGDTAKDAGLNEGYDKGWCDGAPQAPGCPNDNGRYSEGWTTGYMTGITIASTAAAAGTLLGIVEVAAEPVKRGLSRLLSCCWRERSRHPEGAQLLNPSSATLNSV